MARTRSKYLHSTIKEEKHKDKLKLEQMLRGTDNASKTRSKITKKKKPVQAQNSEVKAENANDNKALLASPKKKTFTRSKITAEQIAKLIGYIVNDEMSVKSAAEKVGMSGVTAYTYYNKYRDDPEHKIPLPKTNINKRSSTLTQEKIDKLIRYIVNDGMGVNAASKKAGSCSRTTARKYYLQYLYDPNHEIPNPRESNPRSGKRCTNDQVSKLIGYILNDGLTLTEASVKARMSRSTAYKYYIQFMDDPERSIPTPETNNNRISTNRLTIDQMKNFFCYIIIDKLSVVQASFRAKISRHTGYKYYRKYLKSPNSEIKVKDRTYSVDKMKRFVELVQNKKMSLTKAAYIAHLNFITARKYYQQYLKDPQYKFPSNKNKQYTQGDIKRLIDHTERGKMSVYSAAKKIKMNPATARKYYKEYQNDPEHRIPVPSFHRQTKRDNFTRIIADIYNNNPSIKPIYQIHNPEFDEPDIKIKKELVEEDTKTALKTEYS